jgi:hypothetical protein
VRQAREAGVWSFPVLTKSVVVSTVSPVRAHTPERYRPAPRKCHARVGIQPGYPAPALRAVSPGRWEGAARPMPALRPCRVNMGIEPKGEVRVVCTRSPVLTHSSVQPVPALWMVRAKVVSSLEEWCQGCAPELQCSRTARSIRCLLHVPGLL